MAERRMFAKTIIDSDLFLDMPMSTQLLYFHLSMRADDDGFINNPKKIQRMIGCSDDDMKMLILKQFILPFESGIIVIKHWKIHNYIRSDRYKPSRCEEKSLITLDENMVYQMSTDCQPIGIPMVDKMDTQVRLGKDRIGKVNNMSGKPDRACAKHSEEYEKIISYLNQKAGTAYKSSTKKTCQLINARLAEGYNTEDFFAVIDKKCAEWHGTDMEKFLRPETLFGNKFEGYLNQKSTKGNEKNGSKQAEIDRILDAAFS
ncbi:MAG: conserved phage C-terminal domain-containing protein, partial [Ruminococcus flavefaciens]|nr:conserved phage C-terminal domain-containing protein [Ruminococcus flavefaciens]